MYLFVILFFILLESLFFLLGYYVGVHDRNNLIKTKIQKIKTTIEGSKNINMPSSGIYTPSDLDQRNFEIDKEYEEEIEREKNITGL